MENNFNSGFLSDKSYKCISNEAKTTTGAPAIVGNIKQCDVQES